MVQTSRIRIVTRSARSVATEDTEGGNLSVHSVTHISVSSVLLLLLVCTTVVTFASCQAAADSPGATPTHLLVLATKDEYRLGEEELDPANDMVIFLVWSDNRHEAISYLVPNPDADDTENPLVPNPELQIIHPAFNVPGYKLVYILYKNFYANYYVIVWDPYANDDTGNGGDGDGTSTGDGGGGPGVIINW
jgi:hypothetical protein